MFDRHARIAFIAACVVLIGSGAGFAWAVKRFEVYLQKEPVPLREHLSTIPRTLGAWRAEGEDLLLDAASVEALGTPTYLDRTYTREIDGVREGLCLIIFIEEHILFPFDLAQDDKAQVFEPAKIILVFGNL